MRRRRVPQYRHYKPENLGLVVLDGRYHYLSKHNSPESLAAYHRLVQRWLAEQPDVPGPSGRAAAPSVDDVLVACWGHAESHYWTPDGSPTRELENLRLALCPVHALYGASRAEDLSPLALRAVRDAMVRVGLGRTTVNARVNRIRRAFKSPSLWSWSPRRPTRRFRPSRDSSGVARVRGRRGGSGPWTRRRWRPS